jgi:hypothetical protein
VVYTRDASGVARIYLDGLEVTSGVVGGDLSNWDSTYQLLLTNELTGDRPWLGELHLVAIYDRALDILEVERNFQVGVAGAPSGVPVVIDDGDNDNQVSAVPGLLWLVFPMSVFVFHPRFLRRKD